MCNSSSPSTGFYSLIWLLVILCSVEKENRYRFRSLASSLALNGGGRIFSPRPLPYFPCLLSCLVTSHLLRDSLCIALQTEKIMDLINWSLNAIDTIFSTRSLGSGEPDCPDGTFAAGYTMDAWKGWRIVCLAALSVEDIEDIYLFGTMITGLLLIGLGFALGYRRIQKTGTAVQSLTRLPVMIEAVGRAVSIETETINRNMDSIMEKLTALHRRSEWTKRVAVELECGYSPQD